MHRRPPIQRQLSQPKIDLPLLVEQARLDQTDLPFSSNPFALVTMDIDSISIASSSFSHSSMLMSDWKRNINRFIFDKDTLLSRLYYYFMISIILLSITTLSITTLPSIIYGPYNTRFIIYCLDAMCVGFFTLELFLVVIASQHWRKLINFWILIDVMAVLPFYIELVANSRYGSFVEQNTAAIGVVRVLRVADSVEGFVILLFSLFVLVVFYSCLQYYAEQSGSSLKDGTWVYEDGTITEFQSIPHIFFFTLVALTGNPLVAPKTALGQVIMACAIVTFLFVIAFPLTMVSMSYAKAVRYYSEESARKKEEKLRRERERNGGLNFVSMKSQRIDDFDEDYFCDKSGEIVNGSNGDEEIEIAGQEEDTLSNLIEEKEEDGDDTMQMVDCEPFNQDFQISGDQFDSSSITNSTPPQSPLSSSLHTSSSNRGSNTGFASSIIPLQKSPSVTNIPNLAIFTTPLPSSPLANSSASTISSTKSGSLKGNNTVSKGLKGASKWGKVKTAISVSSMINTTTGKSTAPKQKQSQLLEMEKQIVNQLAPVPKKGINSSSIKKFIMEGSSDNLSLGSFIVQNQIQPTSSSNQTLQLQQSKKQQPGSLLGSTAGNLTQVNLKVVDWGYKVGQPKKAKGAPKRENAVAVERGKLESLHLDDEDDEDDFGYEEMGEKYGWKGGDLLNLTISMRGKDDFKRLLKVLSEFE